MSETVANGPDYRTWNLSAKSEYRFELEANASLAIRLTSGNAEVYGAELAPGRLYLFGGECKAAVFTWYGCALEISRVRRPSTEYTSEETPMVPLINIHTAFEQMRILAHRALTANQPETSKSRPPRVLVLGPENSGKTSACKIWCNYAIRGRSWCPTLINLDVGDGGWTIPGTISACPLSSAIPTCTPANPFGATATSAPTALSSSALLPMVHWFGHTEPKRNRQFLEILIRNLADNVKQKSQQDHTLNASGFIIDTPAGFSVPNPQAENKYSLIKTCVEAFNVNIILIIGHEKLNVELQRLFEGSSGITVLKVPKSGGVVELDYTYQTRVTASQIRAYFYGTPLYLPPSLNPATAQLGGEATTETTLSPFSITLDANDLQIYRIGDANLAPSSALPVGATRVIGEMQPVRVGIESGGILNSVLALLAPFDSPPSDEALLRQEVSGFLIITAVDAPRRKITVLSPSQVSLAGRVALIGSLEWQDRNPSAALIFCKDVDFEAKVKVEDHNNALEFLLADDHVQTLREPQDGDHGPDEASAEISKSMYVVKLLEMIDTVLEHESHLFTPAEISLLQKMKRADYFQQYLISRLVQRKRGKWHRFDHLLTSYTQEFIKYMNVPEPDVPKLMADSLSELCASSRAEEQPAPTVEVIDLTLDSDDDEAGNTSVPVPVPIDLGPEPVSFAQDSSSATPAQLLECLTLDELKQLGKQLKVTGKVHAELVKAILHSTSTQTTLPFAVLNKKPATSSQKPWRKFFPFKPHELGGKKQGMRLQERRIREMCSEIYGTCFRLRDEVFQVLHLVSMVYFRSTEYSESDSIMLSAILASTGKRNYPKYEYKRTTDVFETRADVLHYMETSQLLNQVDNILAGQGQEGKFDRIKAATQVIKIWEGQWDRWNALVSYSKDKSQRQRGLERFEEGYLLTRLAYKAAECFGTLKSYDMEEMLLRALLRQTRWRRSKRGRWYDRIALIYTKYFVESDENLRSARDILLEGLNDKLVHLGSQPMLQRRLQKLEKKLNISPAERYVAQGPLKTAAETRIEGTRVYGPSISATIGSAPTRYPPTATDEKQAKPRGKSIWAGKLGDVTVEALALEYYATLGFRGFHSEGSIVSTLFGLIFWDILFAPVPGAFETPYQSAPLDLVHDSFFTSREDLIQARLDELKNDDGAARRIIQAVDVRERDRETWCVGVRWDLFGRDDLMEISDCLGGRALACICRLLAEEYGYRGSGVPDLFVWNAAAKTCKFVEVKGPGDNLSETQRVWIDVLLGAGVDVEVCRVYERGKMPAKGGKKQQPASKSSLEDLGHDSEEDELWSSSEDGDNVPLLRSVTAPSSVLQNAVDAPSGVSAHTTLLRPITSIPVPIVPGPEEEVASQETVVPESPQPELAASPSQVPNQTSPNRVPAPRPVLKLSSPEKRPVRSNKQLRDMLHVTVGHEHDSEKRKRRDSETHTPARKIETRSLRKRARTSVGIAASPSEWEKAWPEVFPKWMGDVGGSSDADYEPSQ